MGALTILTLIYVAVLVLALAASLVMIWIYLRRIGGTLAEVGEALAAARDGTAPLKAYLDRLKGPCEGCAHELTRAAESLEHADERLAAVTQPAGVA